MLFPKTDIPQGLKGIRVLWAMLFSRSNQQFLPFQNIDFWEKPNFPSSILLDGVFQQRSLWGFILETRNIPFPHRKKTTGSILPARPALSHPLSPTLHQTVAGCFPESYFPFESFWVKGLFSKVVTRRVTYYLVEMPNVPQENLVKVPCGVQGADPDRAQWAKKEVRQSPGVLPK